MLEIFPHVKVSVEKYAASKAAWDPAFKKTFEQTQTEKIVTPKVSVSKSAPSFRVVKASMGRYFRYFQSKSYVFISVFK